MIFGKPLFVNRSGSPYLSDYFDLKPVAGLFPAAIENKCTEKLDVKLFFDPSSTRFLQFHDSDYNELWKSKQIDLITGLSKEINQYLTEEQLLDQPIHQISDEQWGNLDRRLQQELIGYLSSTMQSTMSALRAGRLQNIRMEAYSRGQ